MQDLRRNSDRVEGSAAPENARGLSATDVIPARDTLTIALDETSNTALQLGSVSKIASLWWLAVHVVVAVYSILQSSRSRLRKIGSSDVEDSAFK